MDTDTYKMDASFLKKEKKHLKVVLDSAVLRNVCRMYRNDLTCCKSCAERMPDNLVYALHGMQKLEWLIP